MIEGNTYYYWKDQDGQKYKVSIKVNKNRLPFLQNGEEVEIEYQKEADVINITYLK